MIIVIDIMIICFLFDEFWTCFTFCILCFVRESATLALGSTTLALGFRGVRVGLVLGPGPGQLGPWAQAPGPRAQVCAILLQIAETFDFLNFMITVIDIMIICLLI